MSASGRNWGDAAVDNESLQFSVGAKPLFSVALPDVIQVRLPRVGVWAPRLGSKERKCHHTGQKRHAVNFCPGSVKTMRRPRHL